MMAVKQRYKKCVQTPPPQKNPQKDKLDVSMSVWLEVTAADSPELLLV